MKFLFGRQVQQYNWCVAQRSDVLLALDAQSAPLPKALRNETNLKNGSKILEIF